ncbi:MAG: hypothetical protein LBD61_05280 [Endomicrobium sp.]|jgi:hypothetical protein|nr:hypothetical protein [Endomicrobium sp.]
MFFSRIFGVEISPEDQARLANAELNIRDSENRLVGLYRQENEVKNEINLRTRIIDELNNNLNAIDVVLFLKSRQVADALREEGLAIARNTSNGEREQAESDKLNDLQTKEGLEQEIANDLEIERKVAQREMDKELKQFAALFGGLKTGDIGSFISNIVATQAKDTVVKDIRAKVSGDAQPGLWGYK